jgi:hypothetical protein
MPVSMTQSSGGHVSPEVFTTTPWSVILAAKSGSEAVLNWLAARYRLGGILRETIHPTVESDKDVAEKLEYMANLFGQ